MSKRFLEGASEKKIKRIAGGLLVVCTFAAIWIVKELIERST